MDPGLGSCKQLTSGQGTWSARCVETCTAGAAGGPGKPTGSNPGRAPRSDPTQAGPRAVTVSLAAACRTSGSVQIPSDQAGAERFERPLSLQPRFTLTRMYTFDGGCVTYQFSFVPGAAPLLAIPVDTAVAFEPRADLVRHVRRTEGLALCGRGATC